MEIEMGKFIAFDVVQCDEAWGGVWNLCWNYANLVCDLGDSRFSQDTLGIEKYGNCYNCYNFTETSRKSKNIVRKNHL
jgi:hypothetical protein